MNENEHLNTRRCLFTNADRIRAMSDEELAEFIAGMSGLIQCRQIDVAIEKWLDWLRKEAET